MTAITLVDTRTAGDLLGVRPFRVCTLIRQGYLKDYAPVNPDAKKHYARLALTEVKEFKRTHHVQTRMVLPKSPIQDNGNLPFTTAPPVVKKPTVPIAPVKSFGDKLNFLSDRLDVLQESLKELHDKIDLLVKLWM